MLTKGHCNTGSRSFQSEQIKWDKFTSGKQPSQELGTVPPIFIHSAKRMASLHPVTSGNMNVNNIPGILEEI